MSKPSKHLNTSYFPSIFPRRVISFMIWAWAASESGRQAKDICTYICMGAISVPGHALITSEEQTKRIIIKKTSQGISPKINKQSTKRSSERAIVIAERAADARAGQKKNVPEKWTTGEKKRKLKEKLNKKKKQK